MRSKLANGIEIKTENAAKPETQPSAFLFKMVSNLSHVPASFHYGCGKLRYERAIARTTDVLAIVDSEIQISRPQLLRGSITSIRSIFKASNRIQVYNNVEF